MKRPEGPLTGTLETSKMLFLSLNCPLTHPYFPNQPSPDTLSIAVRKTEQRNVIKNHPNSQFRGFARVPLHSFFQVHFLSPSGLTKTGQLKKVTLLSTSSPVLCLLLCSPEGPILYGQLLKMPQRAIPWPLLEELACRPPCPRRFRTLPDRT